MSDELRNLQPAQPGRRRRYTAEQKRALLDDAAKPGGTISETARRYGVTPSLLFQWKNVMDDATNKGLKANQRVVPESEAKKLKARIRELERMLGKQTMKVEILEEVVALAREKVVLGRELARRKRWTVTAVANALGVSRPHLSTTLNAKPESKIRGVKPADVALLKCIKPIVEARQRLPSRDGATSRTMARSSRSLAICVGAATCSRFAAGTAVRYRPGAGVQPQLPGVGDHGVHGRWRKHLDGGRDCRSREHGDDEALRPDGEDGLAWRDRAHSVLTAIWSGSGRRLAVGSTCTTQAGPHSESNAWPRSFRRCRSTRGGHEASARGPSAGLAGRRDGALGTTGRPA